MELDRYDEEAIGHYTDWLNKWHAIWDEWENPLTRAQYDEYDDPPRVLSRTITAEADVMTTLIHVNPYHDEGGPHVLHVIHEIAAPAEERFLRCIIQDFDTRFALVYEDGHLCLDNMTTAEPERDTLLLHTLMEVVPDAGTMADIVKFFDDFDATRTTNVLKGYGTLINIIQAAGELDDLGDLHARLSAAYHELTNRNEG